MTRRLDPELDRLEHGPLRVDIPAVSRQPDGCLHVECGYGCPLPDTTDVAMVIRMLVAHTAAGVPT